MRARSKLSAVLTAGAIGALVGSGLLAGLAAAAPVATPTGAGAPALSEATTPTVPDAVASSGALGVETWVYPGRQGQATCEAPAELPRLTDPAPTVVKPQYLDIDNSGVVSMMTASRYPCNGYRPSSVRQLAAGGRRVVTTVTASPPAVTSLLTSTFKENDAETYITDFVVRANLAGAELDFQPTSWSTSLWSSYMTFVRGLSQQLRSSGHRQLEVDLNPWTASQPPPDAETYYGPVLNGAHVVVMAFDHQYLSPCSPIAPFAWIRQVVSYVKSEVPLSDVSIGLPAYGYRATSCSMTSAVRDNIPYVALQQAPGFPSTPAAVKAARDPSSGELRWKVGGVRYDAVDAQALYEKLTLVRSLGVTDVSVWALGGNPWFNGNPS